MEIYICDDSRPDLMRLAHHLKEYILNLDMHVEIRSFSSGESILAAYKRALVKPSLIFLDIYMGNMNGMDVARALRDDGFSGGKARPHDIRHGGGTRGFNEQIACFDELLQA